MIKTTPRHNVQQRTALEANDASGEWRASASSSSTRVTPPAAADRHVHPSKRRESRSRARTAAAAAAPLVDSVDAAAATAAADSRTTNGTSLSPRNWLTRAAATTTHGGGSGDANGGGYAIDTAAASGGLTRTRRTFKPRATMKNFCRRLGAAFPGLLTWALILGCTAAFYYLLVPAIIKQHGTLGIALGALDVFLFLCVISNLFMTTTMDPAYYPTAISSEESIDDFRCPLYKNVEVNGITVRMKWCVTCMCFRCIDCFDHHCPYASNCIGRRNYRYFLLFLIFLTLHMISIFGLSLMFTINTTNFREDYLSPPNLCSIILIGLFVLLCIPVCGLTGFHVVLVLRARTTNEQVTGKFRSGFNPFTRGCWTNLTKAMCSSQYPKYRTITSKITLRPSASLSVLYVPDNSGAYKGDGRIPLTRQADVVIQSNRKPPLNVAV